MTTSTGMAPLVTKELESRVLREGYGPGASHGPDLKAALADVTPELAVWRPASGRHSIAEIALHHAYCTRAVRSQLSGQPAEPFVVEGDRFGLVLGITCHAVYHAGQVQLIKKVHGD